MYKARTNTTTSTTLITGNTFPAKDALRALGGRWDAQAKGWRVPTAAAPRAWALVKAAPAKAAPGTARAYRSRGVWTGCPCGARELPGGGLSSNACADCRYDDE